VAEGKLGAAKDGGVKVFIVKAFNLSIIICQRRKGRARKRRGARPGLRGPGGARPPRHATTAAAAVVFVQLAL